MARHETDARVVDREYANRHVHGKVRKRSNRILSVPHNYTSMIKVLTKGAMRILNNAMMNFRTREDSAVFFVLSTSFWSPDVACKLGENPRNNLGCVGDRGEVRNPVVAATVTGRRR